MCYMRRTFKATEQCIGDEELQVAPVSNGLLDENSEENATNQALALSAF